MADDKGFDVAAAKQAGYSDDEILQHLTQTRKFDVDGAVKAGYSKPDIIGHLASTPAPVQSGIHPTPENPDPNQPGMQPLGLIGQIKNAFSSKEAYAQSVKQNAQQIPKFASAVAEDVKGAATSPGTYLGPAFSGGIDSIKKLYDMARGHTQPEPEFLDRIGGQLGVNTQGVREKSEQGDLAGVLGHAAVPLGPIAAAHASGAQNALPERPSPRGVMAARMAEKPPGEQFTRQEVLDAARSKGVNLDLAQATGSPIASGIKKSTEYTLGAGGSYEANTTKNLTALEKWADTETEKYSKNPSSREVVGSQMQEALKSHLNAKKSVATQAFQELDKTIGANKLDVTGSVQAEAQKIITQNKEYYDAHPELKPKQAWGILEDLAQRPTKNVSKASAEFTDNAGNPITQNAKQVSSTKSMSWTELHQLRSDLMDFYRNNPDVVKGRSEAWIQQMVGTIDNAMTSSANGLSGADLAQFRNANSIWESIKSTYDNPQSPYYQAVRTQYPSSLPESLSRSRPEVARQVRETLASLQDGGTVEGAFQRQFVEKLLTNKSGTLDFKNLDINLRRTPDDVLRAMLGDEGAKNLRMLGKVASRVATDSNPSGTAKHVVRTGEVVNAIHNPVGGAVEIGGTYAAGKAMTHPGVVDFLTRKKK